MRIVANAFVPLSGLSTRYVRIDTSHIHTQAVFIHKFNSFQSYNNSAAVSHGANEIYTKLKQQT